MQQVSLGANSYSSRASNSYFRETICDKKSAQKTASVPGFIVTSRSKNQGNILTQDGRVAQQDITYGIRYFIRPLNTDVYSDLRRNSSVSAASYRHPSIFVLLN